MSLKSHTWFRRIGLAAVAAVTLGTATISATPANAAVRAYVGPRGGLHVAVVQHPHHDWWRHHYYGRSHYGYGPSYYHRGW